MITTIITEAERAIEQAVREATGSETRFPLGTRRTLLTEGNPRDKFAMPLFQV